MVRAGSEERNRPRGHRPLPVALGAVALGAFTCPGTAAHADEGGVPFWFSGQYASLAAVPATPGWSLPIQAYYYDGSASASRSFTRGENVTAGLKSRLGLVLLQPTYAPDGKLAGGQMAFGLGFGYGKNTT